MGWKCCWTVNFIITSLDFMGTVYKAFCSSVNRVSWSLPSVQMAMHPPDFIKGFIVAGEPDHRGGVPRGPRSIHLCG